jgi:hypothetical protein
LTAPLALKARSEGSAVAAVTSPPDDGAVIVLVVLLVACASLLFGDRGYAAVLMAPALFVAPGWVLVTGLRVNRAFRRPDEIGLVVVSSIAIMAAGATLMLWARQWYPRLYMGLWLLAAALVAVRRLWSRTPRCSAPFTLTREHYIPLGIVGAGLALWVLALGQTNIWARSTYGLIQIVPVSWLIAVALLVSLVAWLVSSPSSSVLLQASAVVALIVVIFCFVPLLTGTPLYAWSYKHIGVTRFLESVGRIAPDADIYNRWPAFFAGVAMLSKTMGIDPLQLARWAEPFFGALQCALVYGVGLSIFGRRVIAATAAALFLLTNWVGQDYFAPQPAAYAMYLGVFCLISRSLLRPSNSRLLSWAGARERHAPKEVTLPTIAGSQAHAGEVALALLLDLVLVATHQLTPYLLTAQLAVIGVLGFLRKGQLVPLVSLATALAYLAPNFAFVLHKYGLFSGFNPFANAQVKPNDVLFRAPFAAHVGGYLSYLVGAMTLLAAIALVRRARMQEVALLLGVAVAPFVILLGMNYGGEASLRIVLFSSPWCALLIAAGLSTFPLPKARLLTLASAVTLAAIFVVTLYVNLDTSIYPADEVAASEYFYEHAPAGSVLLLAGKNFPTWVGSRYLDMVDSLGDANLLDAPQFKRQPPQPGQLSSVERVLRDKSVHAYLAFSWSQERYASDYGPLPRDWTRRLEVAVKASPDFTLWHESSHVRIYKLDAATAPHVLPCDRSRRPTALAGC